MLILWNNVRCNQPALNFLVKFNYTETIIELIEKYPEAIFWAIQSGSHKSILHEMAMIENEFDQILKEIAIKIIQK